MASFSAGTTFSDGVANDVTAAKLGALVNDATPTSGLIQDRTAETITATNDTLLIGDASDSNNLKRITVANFAQTLPTAKITTGTIETGTFGTTTSTAASITTGTIGAGTFGTTTSTAATITTGTITTGVIPTLTATTRITSGTGTAATPAIVPTGDTNTGIFFPSADTIAFSEGGTESARIDASGNFLIGATTANSTLTIAGRGYAQLNGASDGAFAFTTGGTLGGYIYNASNEFRFANYSNNPATIYTNNTERIRIEAGGNVGIGTNAPSSKLTIQGNFSDQIILRDNATNASSKGATYSAAHYTNAEEPVLVSGAFSTSTENKVYVGGGWVSGNAATDISFFTATNGTTVTGTERARIDSSGNFLIGATEANSILTAANRGFAQINGTTDCTIAFTSNGTLGGYIYNASNEFRVANYSNNPLTLWTNNAERVRISSSGNVSIGTATALSTLHVHGNLTLSNTTTATSAGTSTITPPATVAGYLTVSINGTSRKIPYYAT